MTDRPPIVVWVRTLKAGSQSTYHLTDKCQWLYQGSSRGNVRGRVKQASLLNVTLSGRVLCAYCDGWTRGQGKRG